MKCLRRLLLYPSVRFRAHQRIVFRACDVFLCDYVSCYICHVFLPTATHTLAPFCLVFVKRSKAIWHVNTLTLNSLLLLVHFPWVRYGTEWQYLLSSGPLNRVRPQLRSFKFWLCGFQVHLPGGEHAYGMEQRHCTFNKRSLTSDIAILKWSLGPEGKRN